jgi:hypothetical protein
MKDNWVWKDQYLRAVEIFLYFLLGIGEKS